MMTIRRIGCLAAASCRLATASLIVASMMLIIAQRASAQADGAGAPSAAPAGSRLHVDLPDRTGAVPEPVPAEAGAASGPRRAIHADMGQTARSARKPGASARPAPDFGSTAAFLPPPTRKPLEAQAGPHDGPAAAAPGAAAGTSFPPDQAPASDVAPRPGAAEPPLADEAAVAPRPDVTSDEMKTGGLGADEEQAALTSGPPREDPIASLAFAPDSAALSGDAEGVLRDLANRFPAKDEAMRLQLIAYASGENMSASKARRLSLARALAVRSYLIANGIDGARMDVRALGDTVLRSQGLGSPGGASANRVDIAMIRR